jgi:predicted nucleic acid-binding protein
MADYIEIVEVVEPTDVPRVVPNDADDDHVIAAAIAARATFIVSGDSDLLSMGSHQGIDILSATMAIEQIGSDSTAGGSRDQGR